MVIIISPAKSLDFKTVNTAIDSSQPFFQDESEILVNKLKTYSKSKLQSLLNISDKLAELNFQRYKEWKKSFLPDNSKHAVLAFNGEVYNGLRAKNLSDEDLYYAQNHLRILSGLHGILRPLDLIRPYRLEMGIPLKANRKKDLYAFWGDKIMNHLNNLTEKQISPVIINLASKEYAKAAKLERLPFKVITPIFKELRNDEYKQITLYFKKARGLLTRFIVTNRIETPDEIKLFDYEGYAFHQELSNENEWVFTR